jgi:hypothetical protein
VPSTRTLSWLLVGCVFVAIAFAFTLIATIAEGVALLALLGLVTRRAGQMSRLTSFFLVLGVVLLPTGWCVMAASGFNGDAATGSSIGGAMVSAAYALMLFGAATHAGRQVGAARRGRSAAAR